MAGGGKKGALTNCQEKKKRRELDGLVEVWSKLKNDHGY